ncbi:MAG: CU044_2847 family protein [Halobacteriota archaeon]
MAHVADVANTVKANLSDLHAQHVTMEFGVTLTGGVDFVVSTGIEASFEVAVTWDDAKQR